MKRPPYLSIGLISVAAMAYEIVLMKLFAIIQWQYLASMIISLALLGFGASGTFLSLAKGPLLRHIDAAYLLNILLFGVSSILSFSIAQNIPFNPMDLLWGTHQIFGLLWLYLLLALPFFFVANAIGLMFIRYKSGIAGLYAANLFGSGLGSLGVLLLLSFFFPESTLLIIALSAVLAAVIALFEMKIKINGSTLLLFLLSITIVLFFGRDFGLKINPYKDLSQTLRIKGTKVIEERSSALGRITVVQSPEVPFRYVPGLSMAWMSEPPEQLALFVDSNGMSTITNYQRDTKRLAYLDYQTSALAYHLTDINHTLIIGAGGGSDLLQARYHGVDRIDAIEIDPQMVELVGERYADFSGHLYTQKGVAVHLGEARSVIASSSEKFDLIQMSMVESFGGASAGIYGASENYLYTVEAFRLYLAHLRPGGYLSITRWLKLPPRDTLKLFATAREALEKMGVANPQEQIAMIRGLQTGTLLIKNSPLTPEEIKRIDQFCKTRFFDMVYYPGLSVSEANRYNKLDGPVFYRDVKAILTDPERFYQHYKFDIRPATDNRPYFSHFFKWKTISELFALRGTGGLNLLEWGYLIVVAALLQAVIASFVLILLPLFFQHRREKAFASISRIKVLLYFFALGFGFLFLEIYFIQRFTLFLSHPLSAVAVVLSSFLIFAGFGSSYASRLARRTGYRTAAGIAVMAIILLGLAYLTILDPLFTALIGQPEWVKALFTMALIAPLAFAMGMPFPLGLSVLAEADETMIPWAWGINGCASVISAITATLVSISFGFLTVTILALLFYLAAFLFFPSPKAARVC